MLKKAKAFISVLAALSLLICAVFPAGAALNNSRTEAADHIIWRASEADASKTEGDALSADGSLTLGWTPDRSGSTYANINGAEFNYYITHSTLNGGWSNGAATGTSLRFTAPADGVFTAYVVRLNTAKTFFIAEGGGDPIALQQTTGAESGSNCSLSANVEKGKTYYAYVKSSKGSFCGAAFEEGAKITPPQNLISNPGFEDGTLAPFADRSSQCGVSTELPHDGSSCALVTGRSQTWQGIQYSILDTIEENHGYRAAAWVRLADNAPNDTASFYLQVDLKESGQNPSYPVIGSCTAKKGEWTQISGTISFADVSFPLEHAYLYICSADTNTYDFYADDFEMYSAYVSESKYGPITEFPTDPIDVTESDAEVNFAAEYQKIEGFGGSGAFGSAQALRNMTEPKRTEILDLLFDRKKGIGLNIIRNMLCPQVGEEQGKINLDSHHNETSQGWLMEQGAKYGVEYNMTSVWTPPAWMKDNGSTIGGSLAQEHYQDYADYLAAYIEAYAKRGIEIDVISIANEPDFSPDYYDGCTWTPENIARFVKDYLKPTLKAHSLSTKIMAAEEMRFRENWLTGLINDPDAMAATDIVGVHGYATNEFNHLTNIENAGKQVWMTEIMGYNSRDDTILDGVLWAKRIHQCIAQAGASAWNFWYLANGYDGGNSALVTLGKYGDSEYIAAKRLYTMGNYSKYVRPGARRVESTLIPNSDVYLSAYKNLDGKEVIVAVNGNVNEQDVHLTVKNSPNSEFNIYRTSSTENLAAAGAVTAENGQMTLALPAMSVTTYVTEPKTETVTLVKHTFTDNSEIGLYTPYKDGADVSLSLSDGTLLASFADGGWDDSHGIKLDITDHVKAHNGADFTASLDFVRDNYYDTAANLFFETRDAGGNVTNTVMLDSKIGTANEPTAYSGTDTLRVKDGESVYLCMNHPTGYNKYDNIMLSCTVEADPDSTPAPTGTPEPDVTPEPTGTPAPPEDDTFTVGIPAIGENGAYVPVTNTTGSGVLLNIYIASYDTDGHLTGAKLEKAMIVPGTANKQWKINAGAGDRVMIWDKQMKPYTEAKTL